jgi:hypothetical protein
MQTCIKCITAGSEKSSQDISRQGVAANRLARIFCWAVNASSSDWSSARPSSGDLRSGAVRVGSNRAKQAYGSETRPTGTRNWEREEFRSRDTPVRGFWNEMRG